MKPKNPPIVFLALLLGVGLLAGSARAQLDPQGADYRTQRQNALELFQQGKRLEALPLLESLVQSNPQDDEMLVALAASLVDRAATLSDEAAAAKDRFRARDLLDQAWKLGNTSPLAQNLSHLLKELPDNGVVKFSNNPAVDQIMRTAEAAFARRDFDEALKNYAQALALEPSNYSATLFTANTYDRKNDFTEAGEWYERAMRLGPNVETAFRYYADMLAKQGDMAKARTMLIHAAVAEPYNRMVWRELHAWASLNKTTIHEVYIGRPVPKNLSSTISKSDGPQSRPNFGPAWQAYDSVRANWQHGDAFKKHYPQEAQYRHSLGEEFEALTAAAQSEEKLRKNTKGSSTEPEDPSLALLLRLQRAGLLEAYVLFSLGDDGVAHDYAGYRAKNRAKLEEYMDKFVVPSL
jgi:tetratricopeptide (TPR) repeat protein